MATNMFMKLANITGEADDDQHSGWCEIKAVSQDFTNKASVSGSEQNTIDKAEHGELKVTKYVDEATMAIFKACWNGTVIPSVTIECFRADGQNQALKYFGIKLSNALISKCEFKSSEGDILEEEIEMLGTKAEYEYYALDKYLGTAKPVKIASHDLVKNVVG